MFVVFGLFEYLLVRVLVSCFLCVCVFDRSTKKPKKKNHNKHHTHHKQFEGEGGYEPFFSVSLDLKARKRSESKPNGESLHLWM